MPPLASTHSTMTTSAGGGVPSGASAGSGTTNPAAVPRIVLEGGLRKKNPPGAPGSRASVSLLSFLPAGARLSLGGSQSGGSSSSSSSWTKFHFVLSDNLNLFYYLQAKGKLKGQVALSHDSVLRLSDEKPFAFEIVTVASTVQLQASSDEERDTWIGAIQALVGAAQTERKQAVWAAMKKKAAEAAAPPAAAQPRPAPAAAAKSTAKTPSPANPKQSITGRPQIESMTHVFEPCQGQQFEVDVRYSFKRVVGQGAYGVVVSCHDAETKQDVAVKKIKNVFTSVTDGKRILREVKIMRFLRGHPNLAQIVDLMRPPPAVVKRKTRRSKDDEDEEEKSSSSRASLDDFNDLYIVMPLMDTDLHKVIHSPQKLSDQHVQYLTYQLLSAVHYMASAKIVHRDLKPSNILVNAACELRVCDFGLARALDDVQEADDFNTLYVVTRWYRAPELLLSCRNYTPAIDVWSVGCILAELVGRKPLFPGEDYIVEIGLIVDVLGTPKPEDLHFVGEGSAVRFMQDMPFKPKVPWPKVKNLESITQPCMDLLDDLLAFSPDKRVTAGEALKHPYLALYGSQAPIESCDRSFTSEDGELRRALLEGAPAPPPGGGRVPEAQKRAYDEKRRGKLREAMMQEINLYRTYS